MDEIKSKFMDLLHKQQDRNMKIPSMGFVDYASTASATASTPKRRPSLFAASPAPKHKASDETDGADILRHPLLVELATQRAKAEMQTADDSRRLPDQDILDSIEPIYYDPEADCVMHEMLKFNTTPLNYDTVERAMLTLKQQHKVITTQVLQRILIERPACDAQFVHIGETARQLSAALADCRRARSNLQHARQTLTTNSLEILASYKKRETLQTALKSLYAIEQLRDTEARLNELLAARDFAGAIEQWLECRRLSEQHGRFRCVGELGARLQDTLLIVEQQLDAALIECTRDFRSDVYAKLQLAFRALDKRRSAVDQLHMHFVSVIHSGAFEVLRKSVDEPADGGGASAAPMTFEQLCDRVSSDRFTACYIDLCKTFWSVLVCYYQANAWHQNEQLFEQPAEAAESTAQSDTAAVENPVERTRSDDDEYIREKFRCGAARIWNDIQTKCCTLLSANVLPTLKFEHFIQVLQVVQRLRKVGQEFCSDGSARLLEATRTQSLRFFERYHARSLEEICLFVDNESWLPVEAFSSVQQLQEFRTVRAAMRRHDRRQTVAVEDEGGLVGRAVASSSPVAGQSEADDGAASSVYGSCGYFYSFAEKSSPFDGGFDDSMLEEDILSGIADESMCYYSGESDEDGNRSDTPESDDSSTAVVVNNATLNVLRCIGRYLQMCRLLNSISPNIVASMTELIDFYTFVVHDVFGSDLPVPSENLYTTRLTGNLERIAREVMPKVRNWPPTFAMIQVDLCNADTMYGLQQRAVAVESACSLVQQFARLRGFLGHVLPGTFRQPLHEYVQQTEAYIGDLRTPVFMCVTARAVDLPGILASIGKLRWDIQHVNVEHSSYVETINRSVQTFAMRLGSFDGSSADTILSSEAIWDSLAHVLTHTLVEGYANAKKCSAAGRALMQLDFAHFMSILEMISKRKFARHRTYVDAYIKAYYMPKAELEQWCREQNAARIYSGKQLAALVQCVCASDRKTRQRLLQLLEHSDDGSSSANTSITSMN